MKNRGSDRMKEENLTYEETRQLTRIVMTNKLYSSQDNFDRLMKAYKRYMIAFRRHLIIDTVTEFLTEEKYDCIRMKSISNKINKFLKNSSTVVEDNSTNEDSFVFVEENYNRELQHICRMNVIKHSEESRVTKALIRRRVISKEEVNREPLRYDNYLLKLLRYYQRHYLLMRVIDTKLLTYMTQEDRSIVRLNRKHLLRTDRNRKLQTENLIRNLNLVSDKK